MKSTEWLDRVKRDKKIESDYKLAMELGVSRSSISTHRTGSSYSLDDKMCVLVAEALKVEPFTIIADQNAERAKSKEDKSFWKKYASTAACLPLSAMIIYNESIATIQCILC